MNRKLTQQEKDWLFRGLKTLDSGEYFGGGQWIDLETNQLKESDEPIESDFFLKQVEDLHVVDICNCGQPNCHTIKFQHYSRGESTCLVCYHTEDKRLLIILINRKTGKLAELEIV